MMDELYGLHSTVDISTQQQQQEAGAENMVSWVNYWNNNDILAPAVGGFGDGNHVYGSEQMGSGSSGISDAVSSMVAEIHKNGSEEEVSSAIRAKIASHPLYPKLLEAYIDCQKVGAPRELANLLDEIRREGDVSKRNNVVSSRWGSDPELDEFMGTYCNILEKYKLDLSKPFDEASSFLNDMKTQLTSLCSGASRSHGSGNILCKAVLVADEGGGSSEEEMSVGETEVSECARTPSPVDREIKEKLLRKYGGYISNLKHEFSKKKKRGKLPKEARQILYEWWNLHYRWPYPTEADKAALAESTGLDQRQINNWFINQRKRHWKPPENMQFTLVDGLYDPFFMNE